MFAAPPQVTINTPPYVEYEDTPVNGLVYGPPSPASSDDSLLDEEGSTYSDDGSLTSSCSSLDDLDEDEDLVRDIPETTTPPPQLPEAPFAIYEPEDTGMMNYPQVFDQFQGFTPEQQVCAGLQPQPQLLQQPIPMAMPPVAVQPSCAPKFYLPNLVWDWVGKQQCFHHTPGPFHHQIPVFPTHGY